MKRLFIDLEVCAKCRECRVACDYFWHAQNNGITSLREYAIFALLCRHCEEAPCVNACYHNALERTEDGHLRRYRMRCTSCRSCTVACPFGVIFEDFIPYLDSSCDYCLTKGSQIPLCAKTCPEHAIEFKEVGEDLEKDIYLVGEHLAVHTKRWSREDAQPPKRK